MAKQVARYIVTSGLSGCYMPDNSAGPFQCDTRRELASVIRSEIEAAEFPAACFAQVRLRNLWRHIARHGSSVAHFTITHAGREIAFHGITAEEFDLESGA